MVDWSHNDIYSANSETILRHENNSNFKWKPVCSSSGRVPAFRWGIKVTHIKASSVTVNVRFFDFLGTAKTCKNGAVWKNECVAFTALKLSNFHNQILNCSEVLPVHLFGVSVLCYDRKWWVCVSLRKAYIPSVAVAPYASLQYIAYVWLHNIAVLRRSWLWEPTLCNNTFTVLSMLWSHRQGWWNILAAFVYLIRVCQQMERITGKKSEVYFW